MGAAGRRTAARPRQADVMRVSRQEAGSRRQRAANRTSAFYVRLSAYCLLLTAACLSSGCGYTTRPGLSSHLKTVYVKPFINKIDVTRLTSGNERFPIYRHQMEVDISRAVVNRFQFTGLLRPARQERADSRLEGELIDFHRDPLRYSSSSQVEEWRLNIVVNIRFVDQTTGEILWDEPSFVGDTTYFAIGPNAESEARALDRAITDVARRIVERTVESW